MAQNEIEVTKSEVTKEKFLEWAQEQVKLHPTLPPRCAFDARTKELVTINKPNDQERELCNLLRRFQRSYHADLDPQELWESIDRLLTNGVRGYKDYRLDELLADVENRIIDGFAQPGQTWEEFVAENRDLFDNSGDYE